MRHRKGNKKLSKPTDQRLALLRALMRGLFKNNSIRTTLVRAKQVQKEVDKVITLAKKNTLSAKRKLISVLHDKAVAKLVWTQTERFSKRNSGYTRIISLGSRRGDSAPSVLLEFVDIVSAK